MTKEEFLKRMYDTEINASFVQKIETKYACNLPNDVKKILSVSKEQLFFDEERRLLSSNEIENASEQLHVDFQKLGLLPIIDAYENDFISFNYKKKNWCYFNVNDNSIFTENKTKEALL